MPEVERNQRLGTYITSAEGGETVLVFAAVSAMLDRLLRHDHVLKCQVITEALSGPLSLRLFHAI